jgi:hypothetical protein
MKVPKTKSESIVDLLNKTNFDGVFRRDGDTIFCRVCIKRLSSTKKSSLDSHINTDFHKNMLKRKHTQQRQLDGDGFLLSVNINENIEKVSQSTFMYDLTKMMISADIPLNKLNTPSFRNLFQKYTRFNPPSEPMARQFVLPKLYDEQFTTTKKEIVGKKLWVSIDETRDRTGRFVGAIVLRALDELNKPYLFKIIDLEETNSATICRAVDDAIRSLGEGTTRDDVLMLLTDGARYMVKAGKNWTAYLFATHWQFGPI